MVWSRSGSPAVVAALGGTGTTAPALSWGQSSRLVLVPGSGTPGGCLLQPRRQGTDPLPEPTLST